ncbi:helix-turn-helix domain-containing protein [Paenibacillus provencensis]|uniref:Helix-turn-helix domain-containing protein n=1 Tax=Paenibacillus provencensis TaxID=441151 RepID=A0ABW3PZL1_9BACL
MNKEYNLDNLGKDFEALKKSVRELPGAREYLDSFSVKIGNLVLARRIQLRISQTKLAEMANTTQARISKIEAGQNVNTEVLNQVFQALKLNNVHLIYSDEEQSATAEC